jgi:hypothetical protein
MSTSWTDDRPTDAVDDIGAFGLRRKVRRDTLRQAEAD